MRSWRFMAVAVMSLVVSLSMCQANLLLDPGFESGNLDNWVNNGYYVGTSGDAHSGTYGAAREVLEGVGAGAYLIMDQRVDVTAGLTYDASCWMRYAGNANNSEQFLEIQWVNSSDEIMWVNAYASPHITSVQDYTFVSLNSCTAPVAAVKADIRAVVYIASDTSGGTAWHTFDDFSFDQTIPEPTTFAFVGLGISMAAILRKRLTH